MSKLRIVVADNDPAVLELVTTDLTLEDHVVVATAVSGEDAIERCRELRPDVLVVDYRMPPGLDGLETIRLVRAQVPETLCILYTNYRSTGIADEARQMGALYVKKGPLRALRAALSVRQEPAAS